MYIDGDLLSYFTLAGYVLWFDAYKPFVSYSANRFVFLYSP